LAETQPGSFSDTIRGARERLELDLRAQGEQIQKLNQELAELQLLHGRTEQEVSRQWDQVARAAAAAEAESKLLPDRALENVLTAVRGLMTCTIPEQLFNVLTEEAAQWGVRAAIFDVRGKAAWGASAHGFGPELTDNLMRSLIVQLNQDNPFGQVCETAGHVDASAETLRKNRNILDKLKPPTHAPILLLPIRSAGTVAAIFYADPGEKGLPLPVNGLKILAEFAGAHIDRLIALSGGFSVEEVREKVRDEVIEEVKEPTGTETPVEVAAPVEVAVEEPARVEPPVEEPAPVEPPPVELAVEAAVVEPPVAEVQAEPEVLEFPVLVPEPVVPEPEPPAPPLEVVTEAPEPFMPVIESEPAPPVIVRPAEIIPPPPEVAPPAPVVVAESAPPPAVPAVIDVTQLSEADQKVHKDAKRFAKILVSEIELYNKSKVADGRKNRDLYKRLKSDVDRSRQTFEKRFGKVLSKQFDYFHDELVKALALNDPELLGPEYPGPSA
jgi:hypothetical protein